jgi:hypothetical protein
VPPVGTAVRVTTKDCPLSMASKRGEIAAVRAGLTVSWVEDETTFSGTAEPSVTEAQ